MGEDENKLNILFVSLLVIHIGAAAAWVGGQTMLELVLAPKINIVSRVQAALVSRRIEDAFSYTSWISLGLMSATGITLSIIQGTFNLKSLFEPSGLFLLASILLTTVAIVNALLITFYFTPRLQSVKFAESSLRGLVKISIRFQNLVGLTIIILMVIFTELYRIQG